MNTKKAILTKSKFLLIILLVFGCGNTEFKKTYKDFKSNLEDENLEALKNQSTQHGIKRFEYVFGDLTKKRNQQKMFYELKNTFSNPYIQKDGDSIIYVISKKISSSIESANTLTFIKKKGRWLIDDYRQGK